MDAGLFGARLGLEDAYRFARGEEVMASSGQPARLGRPLDWLVIADHSDGMGFFNDMAAGKPDIIKYEQGKRWAEGLAEGGDAPTFMVYALRDAIGANLDRIQIVKGWLDARGKTHEKVYNVAWSDDREPDAAGKLPPVGNTVDIAAANWTNTIGASELGAVWTDPDFDPEQSAFYYARVLEIPTPRWVVYDAFRFGTEIPDGAKTSHQERAYTSPIWYSP